MLIRLADTDRDAAVSDAEWRRLHRTVDELLGGLDANDDRKLDATELPEGRAPRRRQPATEPE
jgi:hypothetical protein